MGWFHGARTTHSAGANHTMEAAGRTVRAEAIGEKLCWLLRNVPDRETGSCYTVQTLAAKLCALQPSDVGVTEGALTALYDGSDTRPSPALVRGIARAFGVAPAFFDDEATIHELVTQLEVLVTLRQLVMRARELEGADVHGQLRLMCIRGFGSSDGTGLHARNCANLSMRMSA